MTGLKDSPDAGKGGRWKSRKKPGSTKPQAQGSKDGDFPSVSFVFGPRDEVDSSATAKCLVI